MVDISSGDKKINITVSTSGNKASVNATPDTAMYYSNKSREWAISDKIVSNEDYSSKYYANESKKQAETVKNKITEVNSAVAEGITNIINQENISVDNVNTAGATQVNLAKEQATIATTQAGIATAKTSEVVESGYAAITAITEKETTSKNNVEAKGIEQIELIQKEGATQIANVQSTGFYMRDDKLYFINSQGEETEFKLDDIELNNPYSLFDFKWADHELNNICWTRGDTFDWKPSATYPSAYNELLSEYNNAESVEETEGEVTFKRTPKGYKIALADQETAIQSKYETYGIAWYYIIDTANTQFKLPRTKFGFEGLRGSVGDDIAESLPNIKGETKTKLDKAQGAFTTTGQTSVYGTASTVTAYNLAFNASRSSSTYQDGAPVQERATQMYLYFYVGETVQNANLIDAGRIGEQLANKQDKLIRYPIAVSDKSLMPSWYVVYNDGWCEQGSSETISSSYSATEKTRYFIKYFKDTNYTVLLTPTTPSVNLNSGYFTVKGKATNYFTTPYSISCNWVAYGYIN